MILASSSWDKDNSVDFLIISEDLTILHGNLRGLLQDHGQDNNAGGRRRRLQLWFQIFSIGNFLTTILCLGCKYAIIGEGRSNLSMVLSTWLHI